MSFYETEIWKLESIVARKIIHGKDARRKSLQEELNNSQAESDLGTKSENVINNEVFQLLALAVGHGQLPKPLNKDTL